MTVHDRRLGIIHTLAPVRYLRLIGLASVVTCGDPAGPDPMAPLTTPLDLERITMLGRVNGYGGTFSLNADGTDIRRVFNEDLNARQLEWTMDREWAAILPLDGRGIVTVRWDGSARRQIVSEPVGDLAWSPDGAQLVFTWRTSDGTGGGIATVDRDGTNRREVLTDREIGGVAWSPDGSLIAFTRDSTLSTIRPDGTDRATLVTLHRVTSDFMWRRAGDVSWSPDGQKIAFTEWSLTASRADGCLGTVDASGAGARRLVCDWGIGLPTWAGDSKRVAVPRRSLVFVIDTETGRTLFLNAPAPGEQPSLEADFVTWVR